MKLPAEKHTQINRSRSQLGDTYIHQESSHFGTTHVTGGQVYQGNFLISTLIPTAALVSVFTMSRLHSRGRSDYTGQFSHSSLEPVKAYVSRLVLRDQIRSQLCDDTISGNTQTPVVWGLGGAGKAQGRRRWCSTMYDNTKPTTRPHLDRGRAEGVARARLRQPLPSSIWGTSYF